MVPVVCFVGESCSGKTTLLKKLVAELVKRGRRTGVIKHTVHKVELDAEGKDTLALREAGAAGAAVVSGSLMAYFEPLEKEGDVEEIAGRLFPDCDMVIAEGFKRSKAPKVYVAAPGAGIPARLPAGTEAVVADKKWKSRLPVFGRDDVAAIAAFLEKRIFEDVSRSEAVLWVDGEYVEMKPFVKVFVGRTVKGMVSALKGGKGAERVRLRIGR